jgi:hypothetical protein
MVKAYEIIKEEKSPEEYWEILNRDCKEILDAIHTTGGRFLYRGTKYAYETGEVYHPGGRFEPNDEDPLFDLDKHKAELQKFKRTPKDTAFQMHETVNKVLELAGFDATRENSIFCTSDPDQAREYGHLFFIFPIDGFKFTWSGEYKDFYEEFAFLYSEPDSFLVNPYEDRYKEVPTNGKILTQFMRHREHLLRLEDQIDDVGEYNATHDVYRELQELHTALGKKNKRLVEENLGRLFTAYKRYLSKYTRYRFTPELVQALNDVKRWSKSPSLSLDVDTAIATVKAHKFKNTNLASALTSENEIYIKGLFYAFPRNQYIEFFMRRINETR